MSMAVSDSSFSVCVGALLPSLCRSPVGVLRPIEVGFGVRRLALLHIPPHNCSTTPVEHAAPPPFVFTLFPLLPAAHTDDATKCSLKTHDTQICLSSYVQWTSNRLGTVLCHSFAALLPPHRRRAESEIHTFGLGPLLNAFSSF